MGKRSAGVVTWLAIGALVLLAMGLKDVWIGLGVIGAVAFVAYLAIKHLAQKDRRDAYRNEPTLAELIAKIESQRSVRQPKPRPSSTPPTALERPLVNPGQSSEWRATCQATIDANRAHAQALRDKFPPTAPRTNEHINAPAHIAPPAPSPPRAPQNSISPADMPSGSQTTKLPDQSAEWNATRQATIDVIRERAQALRDKFPTASPPTNEQISAPAPSAPSASLPPRAPQNSISSANTPSGSQTTKLPDQSAEWNAVRQAAIDTNRKLAQALREKYPATRARTNNVISAQVVRAPSPSIFQLPPPPLMSGRAITPSSPPEPTFLPSHLDACGPEPGQMYSVTANTKPPLTHALPAAPAGFGEGRWVSPGESIEVAGVNLPGGMLYVGGRLKALNGGPEPCLISGQHTVARVGNYRARQMGYWPSYAEASPEERRAYLNWLSEGRSNPDCDIGYVFLFFYGLERRVILDSREDPAARNDWPAIIVELRRLLAIYGEKSGSFNQYAGELLSWIELDGKSSQLYKQPVPDFPRTRDLPPYLRLALGQAAVDRAPLPAHLALAWIRLSPECYLRTAATRCPNEFERLFAQRYYEVLGPGLVLPKNRTKLKFVYRAASAGLRGANVSMTFGEVPDVTALTAPIRKLMEIANQCTDELGSYSRLVGKDPDAAGALEGLLLLPATLWPAAAQEKLRALTAQMREGRLSLPLKELLAVLGGANQAFNRDRVRGLARALEGAEIGMEPHVLCGTKAPGEQDTIVLFSQPLMDSDVGSRTEYQTAALTLQLASAVAQADGDFHDREVAHLRAQIEGWAHLTLAERRRLHAHLQWLTTSPMDLVALKKKLEPLPAAARETLAAFMATLTQADGFVSPDEVKFLEKVYKALGVEPKRVFSDIHTAGSGGTPASPVQAGKQGFHLDAERIAALQEDTVRVSALLSKIFAEEADSTPAPAALTSEPELEDEAKAPLGLDEDHSVLLRLLLSRPEWTRAELEDAAADLDLMLDGAMEQINEAAFEAFDEPLFEGEDPISVNTKLFEKVEA
jgi:uncharacterized tellurite resistance protein B-like protein